MLFPTVDFAIFFALVFLGHWLLNPKPLPWKLFMIGASYVFYAWWDIHFIWLLAAISTLSQLGAMAVARQQEERAKRWTMAIAVTLTLLPLAYFKYYGFFSLNLTEAANSLGLSAELPLIQVILPVGVSFFSFMAVSYIVDVYRGRHHGRELDRRVPVPVVLPPPGGGADRAPRRADPPAGRAARPSPRRRGGRVVADLRRVVQEGGDLQLPREHDGGSGVRRAPRPTARSTCWSRSCPTRS